MLHLRWRVDCRTIGLGTLFPTCQVRVVRFYVSPISSSSSSSSYSSSASSSASSSSARPQPRPSTPRVPCRTSTTTIHAQCSLPDLNHDHPRPVFPAGTQLRAPGPSVPCWTSTAAHNYNHKHTTHNHNTQSQHNHSTQPQRATGGSELYSYIVGRRSPDESIRIGQNSKTWC